MNAARNPDIRLAALNSGHHFVTDLIDTASRMTAEVESRIAS